MVTTLFLETIYTLIIVVSCFIIAKHTRCLYLLSLHEGIQAFEQAFIYWGIGFLFRYLHVLGSLNQTFAGIASQSILTIVDILFEYFICLGGFFLVYSLIWKQIEETKTFLIATKHRVIVLHALALALALVDVSLGTIHFMFIVQIIALGYACLLTFDHWRATKRPITDNFASLYLVALLAALLGFIVNDISEFFIADHPWVRVITYILTASVFVLVLFGVMRIVHSAQYCERCCPFACKEKLQIKSKSIVNKNGKKKRKA